MLTDDDITTIAQAIERLLMQYDVHLTTDRFNTLHDFVSELVASIMENGQ